MTPISEGQPPKTRPCPIKIGVIWVLGIHRCSGAMFFPCFDWLQQILSDSKEIHRRPRGDSSCAICLCEFEGQRDAGNRRFQVGF